MDGRGFSTCLMCNGENDYVFNSLNIIDGIKQLYEIDDYTIMLQSSRICIKCTGRLHQLFDFNLIKTNYDYQNKNDADKDFSCCFCSAGTEMVCGLFQHEVRNAVKNTRWSQDYDNDEEIVCCYSCYNFLLLYARLKATLDSQKIEFFKNIRKCEVLLTPVKVDKMSNSVSPSSHNENQLEIVTVKQEIINNTIEQFNACHSNTTLVNEEANTTLVPINRELSNTINDAPTIKTKQKAEKRMKGIKKTIPKLKSQPRPQTKISNIGKQELNSRLYEIQKRDENNTDIYSRVKMRRARKMLLSDKADAKDIKKKIQENPTPPISDNTNNLPELNLKNFNAEMDFVESLVPESEMTIFPQLDDVALAPDVAYHEIAITEMLLKTDEDYFEEYKLKRFSIILTKLDPEKLKKIIKANKKKRLMKKSFKIAKSGSGRRKITDNDGVIKNEMKKIKKTSPSTIKLNHIKKTRKSQTVPSSAGSIKKVHVAENKLISLHGMMKKKGTLLKKAQSTGSIQKIVPFQRPASPAQNIYSDDDLPTDLEVIVDYIDYTIREESAAASLQKFDTYTIPEDDCGVTEEVSASSAIYRISSPKETVEIEFLEPNHKHKGMKFTIENKNCSRVTPLITKFPIRSIY